MRRAHPMFLGGLCALLALGGIGQGLAQGLVLDPVVNVEAELNAGRKLQQAAETATSPETATDNLMNAIAHYRTASIRAPHDHRPHALWGKALSYLFTLGTAEHRPNLLRQAQEQFQLASHCPGADAFVYQQWASLLLDRAYPATPRDKIEPLLAEAVTVLRAGIPKAEEPRLRAYMDAELAHCLVVQTDFLAHDPAHQEQLYREAFDLFETPAVKRVLKDVPMFTQSYAVGLLKLGMLQHDTALLKAATKQLRDITSKRPDNLVARYNLACAFAQLGEFAEAMKELRTCIDNDPRGTLLAVAREDTDLAGLRQTDEYQKLMTDRAAAQRRAEAMQQVQAGQAELQQARRTNDTTVVLAKLVAAGERFRRAIQLQADLFPAHYLWGLTLGEMTLKESDPQRRLELGVRARQLFRTAADCPAAEPAVFESWSRLIISGHYNEFTKVTDQLAALYEAKEACERGMQLTRFKGDRARLEGQLALAEVLIGLTHPETETAIRRDTFRDALTHFEAATQVKKMAEDGRLYSSWGIALLRLGSMSQNTMMLRQATERFQTALDRDPDNLVARYNLACVYALLKQPDNAMRHLRVCLDHDTAGVYRTAAQTDPDLGAIRHTDAYKKVMGSAPKMDVLTRPRISN